MSELGRYFDQSIARQDPFAPGPVRPDLDPIPLGIEAELSTGRLIRDLDPALRLLVLAGFVSTTVGSFLGGVAVLNRVLPPVESANDPGNGQVGRASVDVSFGDLTDGSKGVGVVVYGADGLPAVWGSAGYGSSPITGSQWVAIGGSTDRAGMQDGGESFGFKWRLREGKMRNRLGTKR